MLLVYVEPRAGVPPNNEQRNLKRGPFHQVRNAAVVLVRECSTQSKATDIKQLHNDWLSRRRHSFGQPQHAMGAG